MHFVRHESLSVFDFCPQFCIWLSSMCKHLHTYRRTSEITTVIEQHYLNICGVDPLFDQRWPMWSKMMRWCKTPPMICVVWYRGLHPEFSTPSVVAGWDFSTQQLQMLIWPSLAYMRLDGSVGMWTRDVFRPRLPIFRHFANIPANKKH